MLRISWATRLAPRLLIGASTRVNGRLALTFLAFCMAPPMQNLAGSVFHLIVFLGFARRGAVAPPCLLTKYVVNGALGLEITSSNYAKKRSRKEPVTQSLLVAWINICSGLLPLLAGLQRIRVAQLTCFR